MVGLPVFNNPPLLQQYWLSETFQIKGERVPGLEYKDKQVL